MLCQYSCSRPAHHYPQPNSNDRIKKAGSTSTQLEPTGIPKNRMELNKTIHIFPTSSDSIFKFAWSAECYPKIESNDGLESKLWSFQQSNSHEWGAESKLSRLISELSACLLQSEYIPITGATMAGLWATTLFCKRDNWSKFSKEVMIYSKNCHLCIL